MKKLDAFWLIFIHFIIYGAPNFLLLFLSEKIRGRFYDMYLGVLFVLAQISGITYSIEITPDFLITGGNLAYSAFLAVYMIVIISTVDLKKIRTLLYMLIILNLFISLFYIMVSYFFDFGLIVNTYNIPSEYFKQITGSNLVSLIVFIIELFGLLMLLELIKKIFKKRVLIILSSIGSYYTILILDGILFPLIMGFFYPSLEISILSGILAKIICGSGFAVLLGIYFALSYSNIKSYLETPLSVRSMFISKRQLIKKLHDTEEEIKKLQKIIPICANCKKIRDDKGYWNQVEEYFATHSDILFSHGLCPECAEEILLDIENYTELEERSNPP